MNKFLIKAGLLSLLLAPIFVWAVITPNDPSFAQQWALKKIQAPLAWETTTGSSTVVIAYLDTGVTPVPDLIDKMVPGWVFPGLGDYSYQGNATSTADPVGHGTAGASAAAASSNNAIGIASPCWGCKIMPIRITDLSGNGYGNAIAGALHWSADRGAKIANVSFRMDHSATVADASQYFMSKGGVVIMAVGNASLSYKSTDNPNILNVGATGSGDTIAPFSNTGAHVDLVAPGGNMFLAKRDGTFGSFGGTSFSAPTVSGVAGLVFSINPNLTPTQVINILKRSTYDLGTPGYDVVYGWGRINAAKAVALATQTKSGQADTEAPLVGVGVPVGNVTNDTNIGVNIADASPINKIELYIDGKLVKASTSIPFIYPWMMSSMTNGSHTILVKAYDTAGNMGISNPLIVTVEKDTNTPNVDITSPIDGAIVKSTTTVRVTATSISNISNVSLLIDDVVYGNAKFIPYTFSWKVADFTPGQHTLMARATNADGFIGDSDPITVEIGVANVTTKTATTTVATTTKSTTATTTATTTVVVATDTIKPIVSVTSPVSGMVIGGNVIFKATASDNVGIAKVQLYVDGKYTAQDTTAPYEISWDTSTVVAGAHTVMIKAYDTASPTANTASQSLVLTVQGSNVNDVIVVNPVATTTATTTADTTKPTVYFSSPVEGQTVSGKVTFVATASDDVGILKVQLYVDSKYSAQDLTAPYEIIWDTSTVTPGPHKVMIKAYDTAKPTANTAAQTVNVTVQQTVASKIFQKFLSAVRTIMFRSGGI
ncbi:MAG: Ig-like domain-containing protein [Candidatus Paceibacterota bacterium]|jgi:hypothetical protein